MTKVESDPTVVPGSSGGNGNSSSSNFVYVRSTEHAWLPGRLLQTISRADDASSHDDIAVVQVSHPIDSDESDSPKEEITTTVRVSLSDYPNRSLPLQYIDDNGQVQHVDDMVDLPFLHEAAILYNLRVRHGQSLPYTRTAGSTFMIAVNPYRWIPQLYTRSQQDAYTQAYLCAMNAQPLSSNEVAEQNNNRSDSNHKPEPSQRSKCLSAVGDVSPATTRLPPHVYEVSAMSYYGLAVHGINQSILVSGESGAGKTITVTICLQHMAAIGSNDSIGIPSKSSELSLELVPPVAASPSSSSSSHSIVQRVMDSHPLLEAFGNAKTIRNDNSSRFGKYVQLQFDRKSDDSWSSTDATNSRSGKIPSCVLAGSHCEVYLLETCRVVTHSVGERTYHIMYQLLAASDEQKADIWSALVGCTNESFVYVGSSDTTSIEGMSDGDGFNQTVRALETVGIVDDAYRALFRAICTVLQLGNLVFAPLEDSAQCTMSSTDAFASLVDVMDLQGNDASVLQQAFTQRSITARGETLTTPLTSEKAKEACDALAKAIYGQAFLWLVRQINVATRAETSDLGSGRDMSFGTIGLLDIFGFEALAMNGFEQLCINYANEMIQQKFTRDVFTIVVAEYECEGIPLDDITYDDNRHVLNLIEGRSAGIMVMLNEESIRPSGNNEMFVRKARSLNQGSPCLIEDNLFDELQFGVQHYAGPVLYRATDFVAKNADTVPSDLKEAARRSTNAIIAIDLEAEHAESKASIGGTIADPSSPVDPTSGQARRQNSHIAGTTVWTKFKTQLNALMRRLDATQTRYIRCIKPNSRKAPLIMENKTTFDQLRSAGVMAAVTISRSTFPNRVDHPSVLLRFRSLWPKGVARGDVDCADRLKADVDILLSCTLQELDVVTGNTTIRGYVNGHTRAYFRAGALELLETRRLERLSDWAVDIQKIARGALQRRRHAKQVVAVTKIAALVRRRVQVQRFDCVRTNVRTIQTWFRGVAAERQARRHRIQSAVGTIQVQWRMHRDMVNLKRHKKSATFIQSRIRGMLQRPKYQRDIEEKRQAAQKAQKLKTMQQRMADAKNRFQEELEKERELARQRLEKQAEMPKIADAERTALEREIKELKMERELLLSQNESTRRGSEVANTAPVIATAWPSKPYGKTSIASSPLSAIHEPEVSFVEAVPDAERDDPASTEKLQKSIDLLRKENQKLKEKNKSQKKKIANLKENEDCVSIASAPVAKAGSNSSSSVQALIQHVRQLQRANEKLLKSASKYREKISQMHDDMTVRLRQYRELDDEYKTETEIRIFYETTMLELVDMISVTPCERAVYQLIMEKSAECAKMSSKKAVGKRSNANRRMSQEEVHMSMHYGSDSD